jgi:hypothetical protein
MSDPVSKRRPFSFIYNLGNNEITGVKSANREDGEQ